MLFNSIHYFIFAPIVIVFFFMLERKNQRLLLLVSSLYFYAIFRIPFLLVLLFSIAITHFSARGIEWSQLKSIKRVFLLIAITGNLGILYFLKYIDFSIKVVNQILGFELCDPAAIQDWNPILPMGISFFTLQAIAYAVDVYRGDIRPAKNIFHFSLFLSFFPQLVAGPIMRAKDLLHQFLEKKTFQRENLEFGLRLIAIGLFKKSFIADPAGITVDRIFGAPGEYNYISLLIGALFFVIQIYCDFSGYSDIAIGTGRIMGFRIPQNFNRPLLATSITELWRRWHISLSTWLRDYIYIPMGGSRVSLPRGYTNIFISMIIGGVWHGADWTFAVWGFSHALIIILERICSTSVLFKNITTRIPAILKISYTVFIFVILAIFFRAQPLAGQAEYSEGITVAFFYLKRIFLLADGITISLPLPLIISALFLLMIEISEEKKLKFTEMIFRHSYATYLITGALFLVCACVYSVSVSPQFIYFQF